MSSQASTGSALIRRIEAANPGRLLIILGFATSLLVFTIVQALAADPANPSFQRTWQRPDQPVKAGQVNRTWMWGPEAMGDAAFEPYAESPNGLRLVQYYDKARMEITNPNSDSSTDWYVTNGLLVVELMTGKMQTGDSQFQERSAAAINVAGDADDPTGPTYATMGLVSTRAALPDGASIIQRIDRSGTVTNDQSLSQYGVTAAHRVTVPGIDHQVASPFWSFMNSQGAVYIGGEYTTDTLFPTPFYATGLPVTEAYWAEVKVGGTYKDVLIQAFERRVLTYTPDNPAGWQVEAGNVGRHYYSWRYDLGGGEPTAEPTEAPDEPTPTATEVPPTATAEPTVEPTPTTEPTPTPTEIPDSATVYEFAETVGQPSEYANTLDNPHSIDMLSNGNIVIVDQKEDRVQIFRPDGALVNAFVVPLPDTGQSIAPTGVAVDGNDVIWVTDLHAHRIVGLTVEGEVVGMIDDGGSHPGQLFIVRAVDFDANDYFYVADAGNYRVQVLDSNGTYVRHWGKKGEDLGQFQSLGGIAVDASGNVFVSDRNLHRIQRFSNEGEPLNAWGSKGDGDGQFNEPREIEIDADGNVWVADFGNYRIQKFSNNGTHLQTIDMPDNIQRGEVRPSSIVIGDNGDLFVTSYDTQPVGFIHRFNAAGEFVDSWHNDARSALSNPSGIAVTAGGEIYLGDRGRGHLKHYDAAGEFIFFTDDAGEDGLWDPYDVATDANGRVLVADREQHSIAIYSADGEFVESWGSYGVGDGFFNNPMGIAIDADGYVYITDTSNFRVQKFDGEGNFIMKWGSAGSGEGEFGFALHIAVHNGSVYVTDWENKRVQEFTTGGEFVRSWGSDGEADGQFKQPWGIVVDEDGYLYVSDAELGRIQKFLPDGTFYASFGTLGEEPGQLASPNGIALGPNGSIYVADSGNEIITIFAPVS